MNNMISIPGGWGEIAAWHYASLDPRFITNLDIYQSILTAKLCPVGSDLYLDNHHGWRVEE